MAIIANRFLIQTRFDIANDPMDNFCIAIGTCCWCCNIFVEGDADIGQMVSECIFSMMAVCFLTQQEVELRRIKSMAKPFEGVPAHIYCELAPSQQKMCRSGDEAKADYGTMEENHVPDNR
eukprot:CAMPEP_0206477206 /NCGR_PEP_ID=MMETSP0324_2-20121206/35209_1 /ASSEMBLY_ACC=CAM_ASM_000836 /TAXON_ID=2866 /ORGANISM="Crypthecodinium cohnii, Strain Seligo" /LENGTH=120 /DNA_ID=CAMNT_0053953055 /DNA_START=361 /DNA_END=723 /DNA_ORIENTATION=-